MKIERKEIVRRVASRAGVHASEVERIADLLLEEVGTAIRERRSVVWQGFGFLRVTEEPPLTALHPATGESVQIAARAHLDLITVEESLGAGNS